MLEKFYEVTMTVEVTRRVIAKSEEEALEKVDTSDMVHEIKNYRLDEELTVREIENDVPNDYDRIDAIASEIVRESPYSNLSYLRERYKEIKKLNSKLGIDTIPTRMKFMLDEDFIKKIVN